MTDERTALTGVWTASLTPLDRDLGIDHDALATQVRMLLHKGCHGVVLLGTTGEGTSFSVDERIELLERLAEAGAPTDRLIVGCGSPAFPDIVRLARRATDLNYRAILLLPPFYYKDVDDEGLFDFVSRAVEGAERGNLNALLYHIPQVAGVGYPVELVGRLREAYPDTIVGLKDSCGDPKSVAAFCRALPGFAVFPGSERLMTAGMADGAVGCVSATGNATSALIRDVYEKNLAGRPDPDLEQRMLDYRFAIEKTAMIPSLKYLAAERSGHADWRRVRPPLTALNESSAATLESNLSVLPELPNFAS